MYGLPNPALCYQFWDHLQEIERSWHGPWLLIGDFNALLEQKDKLGGRPFAQSSNGGFKKLIDDSGLIDLGYKGAPFTWNNKRAGHSNIQERLDRGLINGDWRAAFPNAFLTHLTALQSDHRPLLLNFNPYNSHIPRPFRFETMWTRDPTVVAVIIKAWQLPTAGNPIRGLSMKLTHTRTTLRH